MSKKEWSSFVKTKIKRYSKEDIVFTKSRIIEWLCKRNNTTIDEMKEEILNFKDLAHVERQEVAYNDVKEQRYRCYLVYSNTRGRCYVLKFDQQIKVITVFPIGRTTLKRYRKRFK